MYFWPGVFLHWFFLRIFVTVIVGVHIVHCAWRQDRNLYIENNYKCWVESHNQFWALDVENQKLFCQIELQMWGQYPKIYFPNNLTILFLELCTIKKYFKPEYFSHRRSLSHSTCYHSTNEHKQQAQERARLMHNCDNVCCQLQSKAITIHHHWCPLSTRPRYNH